MGSFVGWEFGLGLLFCYPCPLLKLLHASNLCSETLPQLYVPKSILSIIRVIGLTSLERESRTLTGMQCLKIGCLLKIPDALLARVLAIYFFMTHVHDKRDRQGYKLKDTVRFFIFYSPAAAVLVSKGKSISYFNGFRTFCVKFFITCCVLLRSFSLLPPANETVSQPFCQN